MHPQKEHFSSAQVMKFVLPSLFGAIVFLMPFPDKDSLNTILGMLIDFFKAILKPWLTFTAMTLVCLGTIASVWGTLCKPKIVMENDFYRDLLVITPFWLVSRVVGALFYIAIFYKIGPEWFWNIDNGGTPASILAPALLVIFIILAGFIPLLTDYGLMEYVGTFARPVMQPLFKLPGRAAVDCLASWVGSSSVAVVITTQVHDKGYYSDREAAIISTTFSVISVAYIYVMADFVKLPHMYFQILFSVYAVTFILAMIMPRIWPLASVPDTYSGKAGKQRHGDDLPEGYSLHEWGLHLAVKRAEAQTLGATLRAGVETFISLIISTMPLVISWGTVVLIIANKTPIFEWMSIPFAWMLQLMQIPEASKVGTAFILGYADQFLSAVVGSGLKTEAARFMCAGISATGLVYMTEVGVLILNSSIPLGVGKLTAIYFMRAVATVFLLAPFAWYFCA